MRNYNTACSSLRPGQLDKLMDNLHDGGREMNEPDKTYFMIEPPSQSEGQVDRMLACPFCGKIPKMLNEADCWSIMCSKGTDCRKNTALYLTGHPDKEDAILWWNTRAGERIAALEDALKRIGDISWGYDGDCGAQAIIDSVIDEQRLP